MTTSLGAKIKRHRQEKGYSLDKLAELTDSSKSYIWELENRDTRKPSGEKLTRIAQALEVTTDYLLDDSEEPSDQVLKEAFFRKFSKLKPEDQEKITDMIDLWLAGEYYPMRWERSGIEESAEGILTLVP